MSFEKITLKYQIGVGGEWVDIYPKTLIEQVIDLSQRLHATPETLSSTTVNLPAEPLDGNTRTTHQHEITTVDFGSTSDGILRQRGLVKEAGYLYGGTVDPTNYIRANYDGELNASRLRVTGTTKEVDRLYAGNTDPDNVVARLNYDGNLYTSRLRITGTVQANGMFDSGTTNPINTTRLNYDGDFYSTRLRVTGDIKNPGFLYTGNTNPDSITNRLNYDGSFHATRITATGIDREPGFFYTGNVDPVSDHRLNYDGNLYMSRMRVTGTTRTDGMFYSGTDIPVSNTRTNYDGYLYATQLFDDNLRVVNYNRIVHAGDGLTGGGPLSADRTVTLGEPSTVTDITTNAVTATSHTHAITTVDVGSTITGILRHRGTSKAAGYLYSGTTDPTNDTRINYDGYLYATQFHGNGSNLTNLHANNITTGTIDLARLPAGALERLVIVSDQIARFALTTTQVQNGDTVKQEDINVMFRVVDQTKLNEAAGYVEYTAARATAVDWGGVENKPTVTAGNGLTGGGNLSTSITVTMGTPSDITGTSTNNVTATSHTHKLDITTLATYTVLATSTETSALRYTGHTKTNAALYGGTTAPSDTTRLNYDGYFYATRVYNIVYSDYAECFDNNDLVYDQIKHRIVALNNRGQLELAKFRSNNIIGIVSDNYGMLLGGSEEDVLNNKKIPVGLAGTLYVDSELDVIDETHLFSFVCSGDDGKANIIPKGEAYKYEGCIVGKIIGLDIENNRYKVLISIK